jgi:hypothetical protein
MRGRLIAGISATVVFAGCANGSAATTATPAAVPVNPSPLPHLTYDCAVLDRAAEPNAAGPLFYLEPFDDGGSGQSRTCALDWDGKFRRQLDRGLAVQQAPDGSRLLAVDYPIVNNAPAVYVALDERNHVLDRLSTIWKSEAVWADDNRHLCYIADSNPSGQGGVAYLEEQLPGSLPGRVAAVGGIAYFPPARSNGGGGVPAPFIAGPHILACSVLTDRAVLLYPAKGSVSVVRLSDGAELRSHAFGHLFDPYVNPLGFERLVASRDGHYLAENIEGAHQVPIIDLVSDAVAARLPIRVLAGFSWDSMRAVVQLNDQVVEVIDWQSQRVVQQLAGSGAFAWARLDSADFLVGVPSTRHQFGLDLFIVRGDGTAFEVARSVEVIGE